MVLNDFLRGEDCFGALLNCLWKVADSRRGQLCISRRNSGAIVWFGQLVFVPYGSGLKLGRYNRPSRGPEGCSY